ncbi:MAG: hypothetical protein QUU85_00985 [Candidatus Eisenbacteria bacterium]|nr:hypothetical protein [Candidatus Eisenbacteria bacterium]
MTSETSTRRSSVPPPADLFDLVVVGAGPAGEQAAEFAASAGKKVALSLIHI